MAQKGLLQTLGLSSQNLLPTLLFHIDGLPHVVFGPICILFSRHAAELTGLPERVVRGFLLVFTAYGVAVVLGLRGVERGSSGSISNDTSGDNGGGDADKKMKRQKQEQKLVPRWLSALAVFTNLAFVAFMTFSLEHFDRDLTELGRWLLRALVGTGLVISSGFSWAVIQHYSTDTITTVVDGEKKRD